MTRIAHIDAETSGLDEYAGHEIWELAVVLDDPKLAGTQELVWQFRPDMAVADPQALTLGRYGDRFALPDGADAGRIIPGMPPLRLTRNEAYMEIQDALRGAWWVGANPAFDERFLRAMFRPGEYRRPWEYRLTCVENLTQQAMGWPTPRGLSESAAALGIDVDGNALHTALGDARLCKAIRDKLLGCELDAAS